MNQRRWKFNKMKSKSEKVKIKSKNGYQRKAFSETFIPNIKSNERGVAEYKLMGI